MNGIHHPGAIRDVLCLFKSSLSSPPRCPALVRMESYKGGLKGYWRRRGYHRGDGGAGLRRRRLDTAELGAGAPEERRGGRRFWRIKVAPRLAFLRRAASSSPRRVLRRIRDAYVRAMLAFSGAVSLGGYGYGGSSAAGFARPLLKEYDERVLVDIYKSLIAASAAAGAGGTAIAFL